MKKKNELTVVNEIEVSDCYSVDDMNNKIISGYFYVAEELISNDKELQKSVLNKTVESLIIDDMKHNSKISTINIFQELQDFLNRPSISETTKKNYTKWLNDFISWCNSNGIDTRKITRMEAENYLYKLNIKYSSNSTRSRILSVSSFYTFLTYRYPKIITINPFYKLNLPTIKLVRRVDVIEENDIKELRKELKRIGRKDIVCCVDLLCKYGFRVGIFENMKIDSKRNWNSVNKEKSYTGKFTESEVKKINETGLLKLRKCTIINIVKKYTNKLFDKKVISCSFSCHDIRHYYITKNGKDLSIE